MDLEGIIRDLLNERNRVNRIIQALEQQELDDVRETRAKSRRGRKSMDGPARREVSERMKLYWAKQRELRAAAQAETAATAVDGKVDAGWRYPEAVVSLGGPDCGERVTHATSETIQ
jgi:hypothetical protein